MLLLSFLTDKLFFNLCNSILKSSIRKLGGYERLLSRIAPGKDSVSLSHGCVALLNYNEDNIAYDDLLDSISRCIDKHPMLGVYIDKSSMVARFIMRQEKTLKVK